MRCPRSTHFSVCNKPPQTQLLEAASCHFSGSRWLCSAGGCGAGRPGMASLTGSWLGHLRASCGLSLRGSSGLLGAPFLGVFVGSRSRSCKIPTASLWAHSTGESQAIVPDSGVGQWAPTLRRGGRQPGGVGTGLCGPVSPLTHPAHSNSVACFPFSRRSPWVEGGHIPLCYLGDVEFGCLTPHPVWFWFGLYMDGSVLQTPWH